MPSQSRIDDIVATAPLLRSETLHLPHSFKIHASALNPTKDLIVLFRLLPSAELSQRRSAKLSLQPFATRIPQRGSASSNVPTHFKGHGIEREEDEDENSGAISLGLWRSLVEASGTDAVTDPSVTPPIWEADIPGRRLAGMTWNHDGSILSLLIQVFEKVPQTGAPLFKLVHLSLDGGAITGKVYLRSSLPYDGHHMFEMFWTAHEPCDERIKRESPWELLDLMPQPNVVEEYVRNNQGPFAAMKPVAAIDNSVKKRAYHSVLTSFPASSVANLSSSRLLCVPELTTQSGVGISFHGSTFPLPYALARSNTQLGKTRDTAIQHKSALRIDRPTLEELEIGRASFAVKELLNVILQGVEHCQGIWKDGIDRERIKWIDELEDAAKSHGATLAATHADLTRLLLAGRCGEAVAQFLGGRITDKNLSAWEQAHYAAAEKIHSLTHHSVKPACEHLLVLGEWLLGLAASSSSKQIHLETSTLQKCLSLTKRMAILAIELNTQIEAETARFRESAKWLRHEIARAAAGSSDEESLPPANHDILSVSDFLTIFLDPPSIGYFLTVDQQTDHSWPESIDSRDAAVLDLKVAMEQTRAKLSAQLGSGPEASRSSSEYAAARSQNSESGVLWGIADILTHEWEQLFKLAIRAGEMSMADPTSATRALARKQGGKLLIGNTVGTATTAAMYLRQRGQVHIWIETQVGSGELNTRHHAFSCHESRLSIVDLNFYDNQNLLIVAEKSSAHPVRYLCQIQLSDLEGDDQRPVPTSIHEHIAHTIAGETVGKEDLADITTVISRAQKVAHGGPLPDLNTCLASNGRPRRRLVCVSVAGGKEIEVFEIE